MRRPFFALAIAIACVAYASEVDLNRPIPSLTLRNGKVLQDVTLVSFSATAVMAKWNGGRGTIAYDDFPSAYQKSLERVRPGYTPPSAPRPVIPAFDTSPLPPSEPFSVGAARTVAGQCFVVTKGGTNIKLGLVEVSVYPRKQFYLWAGEIAHRLNNRSEAVLKWTKVSNDSRKNLALLSESETISHAAWNLLPQPAASSKTDADGRFSFSHNVAGDYVVFARGKRSVINDTEYYVWMVSSEKIPNPSQVFLSNDNMQ
jgi:hypothetical protein